MSEPRQLDRTPRPGKRLGFFTDTTVCIGCKACEVACKQWNQLPDDGFVFTGMSYDNTGELGASTWRHVTFLERPAGSHWQHRGDGGRESWTIGADGRVRAGNGHRGAGNGAERAGDGPWGGSGAVRDHFAWLMMSDVCKHCVRAGCLEACPTGAIVRTEFDSVYVQPDVCNGCGYCVPACPFGVIDRRDDDGRAWKCTLCYDRLAGDLQPACAKACPTDSILFGEVDDLTRLAEARVRTLHERGQAGAYLYGADAASQPGTGGLNAFFLLTDAPEYYNLPPDPQVPTRQGREGWAAAALAAAGLAAITLGGVFFGGGAKR